MPTQRGYLLIQKIPSYQALLSSIQTKCLAALNERLEKHYGWKFLQAARFFDARNIAANNGFPVEWITSLGSNFPFVTTYPDTTLLAEIIRFGKYISSENNTIFQMKAITTHKYGGKNIWDTILTFPTLLYEFWLYPYLLQRLRDRFPGTIVL